MSDKESQLTITTADTWAEIVRHGRANDVDAASAVLYRYLDQGSDLEPTDLHYEFELVVFGALMCSALLTHITQAGGLSIENVTDSAQQAAYLLTNAALALDRKMTREIFTMYTDEQLANGVSGGGCGALLAHVTHLYLELQDFTGIQG